MINLIFLPFRCSARRLRDHGTIDKLTAAANIRLLREDLRIDHMLVGHDIALEGRLLHLGDELLLLRCEFDMLVEGLLFQVELGRGREWIQCLMV